MAAAESPAGEPRGPPAPRRRAGADRRPALRAATCSPSGSPAPRSSSSRRARTAGTRRCSSWSRSSSRTSSTPRAAASCASRPRVCRTGPSTRSSTCSPRVQLVNIALLVRLFAVQDLLSFDFLVAHIVVGASSGYSIITAHELIHRKSEWRAAARPRAALHACSTSTSTPSTCAAITCASRRRRIPRRRASARRFQRFYRRTVPAQFRERLARSRRSASATRRCRTSTRACCATACSTACWRSGASPAAIAAALRLGRARRLRAPGRRSRAGCSRS